jgi:uncharacterized delta-60 repeat protein
LVRFHADGTLDKSFNPHFKKGGEVFSLALQPDGLILVGGNFSTVNGKPCRGVTRLLPTGAMDPTFKVGAGVAGKVHEMFVQPDGKILLGGSFHVINGEPIQSVARLNQTGSLDPSFNPGLKFETPKGQSGDLLWAMTRQPDGRVLVGGHFTLISGSPRARIARLTATGALDPSFDPGKGANGFVQSILVQADGKILIGGGFTTYNATPRNGVARLNPDGSLDTSFNPGGGANSEVHCVAQLPDLKVLIAGSFTSYNAVDGARIVRLFSAPAPATTGN